ncbi:MAG TPA: ferritin family protein [Syntrophorhabdaceae bacterium]|nr:ferritin family protein [Syntrophorhabdaceae bacterium]HPP07296.1 ferritin family protein [Syntrophorhabdaceae bacterium]
MNIFSAADIFQFAIRVEEYGEIFYHKAALNATNDEVRKLFNRLADEEIKHKRIFQELYEKVKDNRLPESYTGEYMAYLRDFIDGKVIFIKQSQEKELAIIQDTMAAIDFAIQRELDSILYYQESKQFVHEGQQKLIDDIIIEERKHFALLTELKKSLKK